MTLQTWPIRVDPTTDQARQWLADELAKDDYHDSRSLLQRFLDWLSDRIQDLQATQGTGGTSFPPIVITLLVVAAAVVGVYLLTRVRREGRRAAGANTLLGDSWLTADQLRAAAEQAYGQGLFGEAVLAWTRAIARDGERRTLLSAAPSLTAHEVGTELAAAFPGQGPAIARTMDLFDAVAYGDREATRADADHVRATHDALRSARPVLSLQTAPRGRSRSGGTGSRDARSVGADEGVAPPTTPPDLATWPEHESVWTAGAPR